VQRLLQVNPESIENSSTATLPNRFGHSFSRISVFPKAPTKLQAKLTVNTPGDQYEQEADRVADRVVNTPDSALGVNGTRGPAVQRACMECEEKARRMPEEAERQQMPQGDEELQRMPEGEEERQQMPQDEEEMMQLKASPHHKQSVPITTSRTIQAMRSGGQPLPKSLRNYLEPRFGHEFSQVRLHTDDRAIQASKEIGAKAFTLGKHIAFGERQFQPHSKEGKRLIAHELTHVVQQNSVSGLSQIPTIQRQLAPPGNCSQGMHDKMQRSVKAMCDHPSGRLCKSGESCHRLRQKINRNQLCSQYRRTINNVCYNGGDLGHQIAERDARRAQANCMALYRADPRCRQKKKPKKVSKKKGGSKALRFLGKGARFAAKAATPVIFVYDWYDKGFTEAANNALWPISELWD
jgi:hypothetical protein